MTADGAKNATKPKDKLPACKLSTIINKQFMAVQMIGKGGYGVVYEVVRLDSPTTRFACKAELAVAHNNLKTEWDLMTLLKDNKSKHNIIGVELGAERNFNYIIMHLVGPSLADLRKSTPKKTFTLFTTAVCSIQCFDSLVELHKLGYIHRDVKPSNFAIGVLGSDEEKLVYVLDFGLCRNMFKNKELRKPRMKAPFRGTIIYCSMNIHQRMEPGRHDDFWSLLYMMIEFHLGDLPWDNMSKEETKKAKDKKIDDLLSRCPAEFKMMRCYLLTLTYSREPDYVRLRALLCQIMHVNKFTPEMPLDWQVGGECESVFKPRAAVVMHKGSKKKINLSELLDLTKPGDRLLTERDFPQVGEQEPPRDESVSKSDDTIIEKEGPPPAVRQARSPVHQKLSAETQKPLPAQASNHAVQATKPAQPVTSIAPKLAKEKQQQAGTTITIPAQPPVVPLVPLLPVAPKPTVTAVPKPPTTTTTTTLPVVPAPLLHPPKAPMASVAGPVTAVPPPLNPPKLAPTTTVTQPPKLANPGVSTGIPPSTAMPQQAVLPKTVATTAVPQPPKQANAGASVGMPPTLPPPPKAIPIVSKPPPTKK